MPLKTYDVEIKMFVRPQRAAGAGNAAECCTLNGPLRARSKDKIRVFRDVKQALIAGIYWYPVSVRRKP